MISVDIYGLTPNSSVLRFVLATVYKNEVLSKCLGKCQGDYDYIKGREVSKLFSAALKSVKLLEAKRNNIVEESYDNLEEMNDMCELLKLKEYFSKLFEMFPEYLSIELVNKNKYYDEMSEVVKEDLEYVGYKD